MTEEIIKFCKEQISLNRKILEDIKDSKHIPKQAAICEYNYYSGQITSYQKIIILYEFSKNKRNKK